MDEVNHKCTQTEVIDRMSLILVGNGHPEDGLAFKVRQMFEDVSEIKTMVNKLHERADENKKSAETAIHAVDAYKKEVALIDKTKIKVERTDAEKRAERRDKIRTTITIVTAVLMVAGIITTIALSNKNVTQSESNGKAIKDAGTPVIIDSTGKIMNGRGVIVGHWPQDFIKPTDKKK